MKRIYKYPFEILGKTTVSLPVGAKILTIQIDEKDNTPCIWALVDPTIEMKKKKTLYIYGTGHDIHLIEGLNYLSTIQKNGFVWHIFDEK